MNEIHQYLLFMALLSVVYLGFKVVEYREKKRMKKYYGYTTRRRTAQKLEKAA